jgi:hypothetical protein
MTASNGRIGSKDNMDILRQLRLFSRGQPYNAENRIPFVDVLNKHG